MPSTSPAQARLMRAAAHGWRKPGGGGPSEKVAKDFVAADKAQGKHMKKGGHMKSLKPRLPAALADQSAAPPPNAAAGPSTDGGMPQMKKGGKVKKFAAGGETLKNEQEPEKKWPLKGEDKDHHGKKVAMKKGGRAKHHYAKGGSVRGDGIAERGHTRGNFR